VRSSGELIPQALDETAVWAVPGPGADPPSRDPRRSARPHRRGRGHDRPQPDTWTARDARFWVRYFYVSLASFTAGGLFVFAYLLLTTDRPHRALLMALDAVAVLAWIGITPVGLRLMRTPWRIAFLASLSMSALALVTLGAGLDGGASSPLAMVLVLPLLYAGLVYPSRLVGSLGVVAVSLYAALALIGTSGPRELVVGTTVVLAGLTSTAAAATRTRMTTRLNELATHDELTGCLNRRAFDDALRAEAVRARRYGRPFSVIMADLDRFKAINDTFGHAAGDTALRTVASVLEGGVRAGDVVGHVGGDEFAVLLPETGAEEAAEAAVRLGATVRDAQSGVHLTMSLGVSTWSGPEDSAEVVVRRADQALYTAKQAGRDQVEAYVTI